MHQTFYIDIDEEISSVVDRLNKSMAMDNYFVVPKRAIFLQSIVNLKLLKREADKAGKHVILVTQDEIGTSMANRSGIGVRSTLEGLEAASDIYSKSDKEDDGYADTISGSSGEDVKNQQGKQIRLKSLGSNDYYDSARDIREKDAIAKNVDKPEPRRIPVNSVKTYPKEALPKVGYDVFRKESVPQAKPAATYSVSRERSLEKMFSPASKQQNNPVQTPKSKNGERKTKKIFFGFIILCLLALSGVAAYLLVPSAKIIITPNILKNKIDVDIHGSSGVQTNGSALAVRVINQVQEVTLSYDAVGKGTASGKKAHGSVVIYNEYNSSSQVLVATTRLASADGKVFRLIKSVTVPGTTVVGSSVKPGAIEADVIADQAGSDYNIDAAKFTIPGFAGGPKFDKFYAKSSAAMTGGTSEGASSAAVDQQDIANAKVKTETALKNKIDSAIAGQLQPGEAVLPETEKITINKSAAAVKIGDMVSSFDYTAAASVTAMVFSEEDVKKIVQQSFDSKQQVQDAREEVSKIEYGTVSADFEKSTIDLKVHGEMTITPNIDAGQIKKEVLGKNSEQLADIFKKYPSVKNVNIEFHPTFFSWIPQYSRRVDVQVDTSGK